MERLAGAHARTRLLRGRPSPGMVPADLDEELRCDSDCVGDGNGDFGAGGRPVGGISATDAGSWGSVCVRTPRTRLDVQARGTRKVVVAKAAAVVGPHDADERINALAEQVGRLLGLAGWAVFTGGLGGVMEAACKGAQQAGALTVGI